MKILAKLVDNVLSPLWLEQWTGPINNVNSKWIMNFNPLIALSSDPCINVEEEPWSTCTTCTQGPRDFPNAAKN